MARLIGTASSHGVGARLTFDVDFLVIAGGGGGGSAYGATNAFKTGGNGGSGIVIVRYAA